MMLSTNVDLTFEGKVIRIVDQSGDPWFVLAHLCRAMNIKNVSDAAAEVDDDEKATIAFSDSSSRQRRRMLIVSEPAALMIIMKSPSSRKEGTFAYRFRRWVTHEVLPSIRQHGQYPPPAVVDPATLPKPDSIQGDDLTSKAGRLIAELRRISNVQDRRELQKRFEGVISKNRFAQLKDENGTLAALRHEDTWYALLGAGVDLRYVLDGVWLHTPDERALLDDLRTLDDQAKAVAMHRIGGHIETLRIASDQG